MTRTARKVVRRLPRPVRERVFGAARWVRAVRRPRPRWGNLRRTTPFSDYFGFDRGTPVDRYYLHRFFAEHGTGITGAVLEVKDPAFTDRYGHDVTSIDLVDIDVRNQQATVLVDLAEAGSLPAATWDCVIVPQTINLVDDPRTALANLWQALRPGGVLLVTVPTLAGQEPVLRDIDRWRLLPLGLQHVLEQTCTGAHVTVRGYGNLLTATAFLQGLAADELREDELEPHDPHYPLVACARVEKPAA
jgi:SAM-dependent methyltransferase